MPKSSRIRGSELDFIHLDPPAHGHAVPLVEGVWWARLPIPGGLAHINVWLLEDDGGWTLVDTGMGLPAVREAWAQLDAALAGRPLKRIIVTHHHPDHFGQAKWLSERHAAPVWMSDREFDSALGPRHLEPAERAVLRRAYLESHGLQVGADIEPFLGGQGYRRIISGLPERIRPIRDHEPIEIGALRWRAIITPGHSDGHVALYCREAELLISGDHVLPGISPNISLLTADEEANPLGDYLGSFARFRALPENALVLPSHGRVFRALHKRLDQLEREHGAALETARDACGEPQAGAELIPLLFPRRLDALNTLLAFGETLAHLRYLQKAGEVETLPGAIVRFQRVA